MLAHSKLHAHIHGLLTIVVLVAGFLVVKATVPLPTFLPVAKGNASYQNEITLQYSGSPDESLHASLIPAPENAGAEVVPAELITSSKDHQAHISPTVTPKNGAYNLVITTDKGAEIYRNPVLWGVLTFNAEKSVYQAGETAKLSMAVLDSAGRTVCDGLLRVSMVHQPSGRVTTASTEDGSVVRHSICSEYAYHEVPDYETSVALPDSGTYTVTLTAVVEGKEQTYTDTLIAEDTSPIVVSRLAQTRLYPPVTYPMRLMFKVRTDFSGPVYEVIPEGFEIGQLAGMPAYSRITTYEGHRAIEWDIAGHAGETLALGYSFKSPNISPQNYSLGPLVVPSAGLREQRKWALANDTASIEISGTAYSDEGVTALGANRTIRLKVNGADACSGPCTAETDIAGAYTIANVMITSGDVISVWIGGESEQATTVTIADAETNVSGIDLYQNHLIVRHEGGGTVTAANLATWDSTDNPDIAYAVSGSAVTVANLYKLFIHSGTTFAPGGAVTTSPSSSAAALDGDLEIASGATLAMGAHDISIGGDLTNSGSFTIDDTQTVALTATSSGHSAAFGTVALGNLTANGTGGGWSLSGTLTLAGDLTVTDGALSGTASMIINGGDATGAGTVALSGGTFTLDGTGSFGGSAGWSFNNLTFGDGSGTETSTASGNGSVTVGGVVTITPDHTLSGGAKTYILNGSGTPFVKDGTFVAGTSTVSYRNSSGATLAAAPYYNIDIIPDSGSGSFAFPASSTVTASGNVTVAGSGSPTLDLDTTSTALSISGSITIGSGATLSASSTDDLVIGKDFTNSGTFTANSGTAVFNTSSISTLTGDNTAFYNFKSITAGKRLYFTAGETFQVDGLLTLTGGSGNLIMLDSTDRDASPAQWTINHQGTEAITYTSVTNSACASGSTTIDADDGTSTNGGNNGVCWSFGASNHAPDLPGSLTQKKVTGGSTVATGGWTNETQLEFSATVADTDNPDSLQLCVEVQPLLTSFTNTDTQCGSGASYSGSGVTASVAITGLIDTTEYHWQARVKDSAGSYSAWTAYGGNGEGARDFGIDTTAPASGTVYDGASDGVDGEFNSGSLSELSANWDGFSANVSGLEKYEYAIGTTPGGTEVRTFTSTGTTPSVSASGLILQTSQHYYVSVRATDNAGNTATATSDGQSVTPQLSFGANPTSMTFDNLNAGNDFTDTATVTLTTSTNARHGYIIRAHGAPAKNLGTNDEIAPFSGGTYDQPAAWGDGEVGFGYTSDDPSVQGNNKFGSTPCDGGGPPPCFAPFSSTMPGDIVADHTDPVNGSPITDEEFTITLRTTTHASQGAGQYTAMLLYTVTALY